jgi:hypothetical protein
MELYSGARMVDDKYEETNVAGSIDQEFTVYVFGFWRLLTFILLNILVLIMSVNLGKFGGAGDPKAECSMGF